MTDRLGDYIKQQRTQRGWTQVELADRAGVPKQTVNRLETGTTKLPGALIRRQIAEALGVSHLDLLIAAGEITTSEANPPKDPRSDAVRRLAPVIDQYEWDDVKLETAERLIRSIGEMYQGRFPVPSIEE